MMLTKIKHWFVPPVFDDEEKTRTAVFLNFILVTLVCLFGTFGIALWFLFEDVDFWPLVSLGAAAISIGLHILMRWGAVRLTAILLVAALLLMSMATVVMTYGGIRSPGLYLILTVAFVAGLLLGVRALSAVVGIIIVFGIGLVYAESGGLMTDLSDNIPLVGVLVIQVIAFVIIAAGTYLRTAQFNRMLQRSRQNEHELWQVNQKLTTKGATLEGRIATLTHGLSAVAELGERLTNIHTLDQFLVELVDQVQIAFGYYHVQIYIMDEQRQRLVMVAGVGESGVQMKAQEHEISLDMSGSLVAQAARRGDVVLVSNVRESAGWQPNPLLPDTVSEMVVPIFVDAQVVGVLDVQQDNADGLNDDDVSVLRTLVNQVTVAIRNARQFEQAQVALTEAQAIQGRYIIQAWDGANSGSRNKSWLESDPGLPDLDQTTVAQAKHLAFACDKASIVALNGDDADTIVAPVRLANQSIGALQIHRQANDDKSFSWNEDDLALVEAVLDQVALTAENLRLFEQTRERATRERLIGQVNDKLRQASNMETLMEVGLTELTNILGVDRAFVHFGSATELNERISGSDAFDIASESAKQKQHQGKTNRNDDHPLSEH